MGDVAKVISEATTNRERQQLSAIEPETTAARMTFGSVDHYRMCARPTQSRFGVRYVAQFDRTVGIVRPPPRALQAVPRIVPSV